MNESETQSSGPRLREPALTAPLSRTPWNQTSTQPGLGGAAAGGIGADSRAPGGVGTPARAQAGGERRATAAAPAGQTGRRRRSGAATASAVTGAAGATGVAMRTADQPQAQPAMGRTPDRDSDGAAASQRGPGRPGPGAVTRATGTATRATGTGTRAAGDQGGRGNRRPGRRPGRSGHRANAATATRRPRQRQGRPARRRPRRPEPPQQGPGPVPQPQPGRPTGVASAAAATKSEPVITEDDVLIPIAGILDVLDNYGFVRTTGYLPGSNDVYVSLSQVRRYGLRKGDVIEGAIRQPREGERREKFNALVRLDKINGLDPRSGARPGRVQQARAAVPAGAAPAGVRPDDHDHRIIDLICPIGKGQRGLIVSPPKAGKTMILQAIANAITKNNPECHLMVVLVDERPEEVTDMQRSVKGEVIHSTFDRPAEDHTMVAELAIERAKRLVEMGHDVVVLLDSITRLGRAYNLAAPASGRIMSGGVDSTALYPPKRFFGAARNIEHGGSLRPHSASATCISDVSAWFARRRSGPCLASLLF